MVRMEDAVIARYEHSGHRFELLVDPDLAMKVKHGTAVNMDNLLAFEAVYKDAHKGEEAGGDTLKKVFGTTDVREIARKVIRDGEVQLTTEQRRQMLAQKRTEVIAFIAANAIDPKTKSPHPPARIENAMEEARVRIDPLLSVTEQVPGIIKALRMLLPISMEQLRVAVHVPAAHAGRAAPLLHKYHAQKQEWQNDGSIVAVFELPAGMKASLFNELNHLTHGEAETRILDQ